MYVCVCVRARTVPSSEWLHTGFCYTLRVFPSFLVPELCLTSSSPRSSTLPGEAFPSTMLSKPVGIARCLSRSLESSILSTYCCSLGYYWKVYVLGFIAVQHWTCGFISVIITDGFPSLDALIHSSTHLFGLEVVRQQLFPLQLVLLYQINNLRLVAAVLDLLHHLQIGEHFDNLFRVLFVRVSSLDVFPTPCHVFADQGDGWRHKAFGLDYGAGSRCMIVTPCIRF